MKIKIYCLFFLFLICNITYSRPLSEDSLLVQIDNQNGIKKLETLYDLQQNFLYESKDWHYNSLLLEEAKKQNNISFISIALRNRVAYYHRIFENDSIFYYAKIAEDYATKHDQKRDLFLIKKIIIQRYLGHGLYSLAMKEATEMNKAAIKTNDSQMESSALEFQAKVYQALEKNQEAVNCMQRSRKLLLDTEDAPYNVLGCYLTLSDLYEEKNDKDSVFLYADSLRKAIQHVQDKYPTYNLMDYKIGNHMSFIFYYLQNNRLDDAWEQIKIADELIVESQNPYFVFLSDLKKMEYYRVRKDYEKMNYYYQRNDEYSQKNNLDKIKRYLLRFKAMVLGEQGKLSDAVVGYQLLEDYIDSLNFQRYIYEITHLGMEFELNKKDDQIVQQANELRLKTRFNIALIILVIVFIIVTLIIIRYLKIIRNKNRHLFNQIKELTETKMELMLFKECVRERVGVTTGCSNKDNQLFEKVEELMSKKKPYINSEYGRKNLITDMCTNEVYLSRAIRKGINMTIQEYINSWRMEYAKYSLLQDMSATIESVAMDSGFSSIRNFYRLFKEAYGMSPAEFRNYVNENYKT